MWRNLWAGDVAAKLAEVVVVEDQRAVLCRMCDELTSAFGGQHDAGRELVCRGDDDGPAGRPGRRPS
jgi:hypothetical protein